MTTLPIFCSERFRTGGTSPPAPVPAWYGWLKLLLGLGLLWLFVFGLAPAMQRLPALRTMADYVSASGISAGALYYTNVEEVGEAETSIRDSLRFRPGRKP